MYKMPNYVRFSDNAANSNNSYQLINNNSTNEVLEQHRNSPQDLQREQENFQQQNFQQTQQQFNSQTPLPNFDDETRNKQLELRQKQQKLQQERYQSSIPNSMSEPEPQPEPQPEPPITQDFSNMSFSDIQQRFPGGNEVYINEIHRLLQNENTLTLDQASNIAQGNGCGMDGYNNMCPSRPIESFRQKGDCVGDDCDVTFSTNKKERYEMSMVDKIKDLDVTFYTNAGCGFCQQTKQLFENSGINLGSDLNVSTRLPDGVRGFPHFESSKSGKSHTGFPGTLERLHDLLS